MSDLPTIHFEEPRVLAALPPQLLCGLPPLGASYSVLPRDQWRETDLSYLVARIRNQGRTSECVGCASATATEVAWADRGFQPVLLSAGFIYAQINGGRDQGAIVADAARELATTGACLESEAPQGVIYKQQIPQSAYATAQKYRLAQSHVCDTFDAIGTALTLGFPCVGGFLVGQNFTRPNSQLVVPLPDRILGGHALALLGLKRLASGQWVVLFVNSWGSTFGRAGFAYMDENFFNYSAAKYGRMDAYALEATVDSSDVADQGPVAEEV